jgi:DNA-binding MarR family transcriptional regulator
MPPRTRTEILFPIDRAGRRITAYCCEALRRTGLPHAEAQIVCHLDRAGPRTVGDLLAELGHPPSTLTSLLNRLSARELVQRSATPGDGRSFTVRVTPRGRTLAKRAQRVLRDVEATIAEHVRPADLRGFRAVITAIGSITGGAAAPPPMRRKP